MPAIKITVVHPFLKPAITALVLWFMAFSAYGQAPAITYFTPNVYIVGTVIPALSPSNTGGAVPATIYGETKVIAGSGTAGANDGNAATAQFIDPYGLAIDAGGNIYVAESAPYRIRMITSGGTVTTVAPDGIPGSPNVASPKFNTPHGVVRDAAGNLYVANYGNHNILKILPDGTITIFAGGYASNGAPRDGLGADAAIIYPNAIAIDAAGTLYVSDGSNLIRKISPAGNVSTFAGSGMAATVDGRYNTASFNVPAGLVVDAAGNIFVAEQAGRVIRKITVNGEVTTFAGSGQYGSVDGTGSAASFEAPLGVTVDPTGNLYVTDAGTGTIRRISPDQVVTTIAGGGPRGTNTGVGSEVSFSTPSGIGINPNGNLYITEINGNIIKQVIATGYVIDKALPAGLVFDPKTGIITGTPTVTWPATDYKITAFNAGGSSSFVVNIKVNAIPEPTLIASVATGNLDACIGSISTTYQQFTVAGTSLTSDIVINAPLGFEVSLSTDLGYSKTLTLGLATLDPDETLIYVHLAATAVLGANTGEIIVSSNGATDAHVVVSGEVKPIVTPAVSIAQQTIDCPGQPVTFVATPVTGTEGVNPVYEWYVNGVAKGVNRLDFTPAVINSADIVTFKLTNTSDCTIIPSGISNSLSPQYKLQPIDPEITIQATTNVTSVCAGTTVSFEAQPSNPGSNPTYQWMLDGVNAGPPTIHPFYSVSTFVAGNYKVSCVITNTDVQSCVINPQKISNEVTITVLPSAPPTVSIDPSSGYPACEGSAVTFTANSPDAASDATYQWQVNHVNAPGGNSRTFTSSLLKTDDVLTCIVTNPAQCGTPGTNDFTIQTNVLPTVSFNGNVTIKRDESVTLSPVLSPGILTFRWSPSVGLSDSGIPNPVASPEVTTTYTLTVANAAGECEVSANVIVTVINPMVIPSVFTPNADGINDTWSIPALAAYPNCAVNVFNRYGAQIFRSLGYSKDWNGSFNGYVLPAGTYYYVVDLKNGSKPLSGYVVLLK